MLDRDDLEPVLEAAAEAWNETFDTAHGRLCRGIR